MSAVAPPWDRCACGHLFLEHGNFGCEEAIGVLDGYEVFCACLDTIEGDLTADQQREAVERVGKAMEGTR